MVSFALTDVADPRWDDASKSALRCAAWAHLHADPDDRIWALVVTDGPRRLEGMLLSKGPDLRTPPGPFGLRGTEALWAPTLAYLGDLGFRSLYGRVTSTSSPWRAAEPWPPTVSIELPWSIERASGNHRRAVATVERSDVAIDLPRTADWHAVADLVNQTLDRVGAAHRTTAEYLAALAVEDWRTLLFTARIDGRLVGVALFVARAGVADYWLGGWSKAAMDAKAPVALIARALTTLSEQGVERVELGGGAEPGDGLEAWKRRFGGSLSWVGEVGEPLDRPAFDAACTAAGVTDEWVDLFPPWLKES